MRRKSIKKLGKVTEPMNEDQYWDLVEKSLKKTTDMDEQEAYLIEALSKLSPKEMIGFTIRTHDLCWNIHNPELWCAGYLMNGGCSDDGFEYFKYWIISCGKEVYYNAQQNPDSLINAVKEEDYDYDFEAFMYVGAHAFEETTDGDEEDYWDYETFLENHPNVGNDFELNWHEDEPETMKAICPQLYAKFWETQAAADE